MRIITEKIGDSSVLKSLLGNLFAEIKVLNENDEKYDIYLKIFDTLSQSKSDKILYFIIPQIFNKPIPTPLIEVITNNSEVFA